MTPLSELEFLRNENAKLLARALEAEHRRGLAEKRYSDLLMKLNDMKGTDLLAYPWQLPETEAQFRMRLDGKTPWSFIHGGDKWQSGENETTQPTWFTHKNGGDGMN